MNNMVVLLGSTGYIGGKFAEALDAKGIEFEGLSRKTLDYTDKNTLKKYLKEKKPIYLINAAGYTGKPNVDACEDNKAEALFGNAVFPGIVRQVCEELDIPWGHVSSGCIYNRQSEHADGAFTENDVPNFSFRTNNCSFYSGTKALGEEILKGASKCYVWRLRIPFNHEDSPRNYLKKVVSYPRLLEAANSLSHVEEYVEACMACFEKQIPYGVYNVTNPGFVKTSTVVNLMLEEGKKREAEGRKNPFPQSFDFFDSEEEFMEKAARTPRSNCCMNTDKLQQAGIVMTPIEEVVRASIAQMEF